MRKIVKESAKIGRTRKNNNIHTHTHKKQDWKAFLTIEFGYIWSLPTGSGGNRPGPETQSTRFAAAKSVTQHVTEDTNEAHSETT